MKINLIFLCVRRVFLAFSENSAVFSVFFRSRFSLLSAPAAAKNAHEPSCFFPAPGASCRTFPPLGRASPLPPQSADSGKN